MQPACKDTVPDKVSPLTPDTIVIVWEIAGFTGDISVIDNVEEIRPEPSP